MTSERPADAPPIPIQVSRGSLIASVQVDLGEAVLRRFQQDLLAAIRTTGVTRVVLDLSSVTIVDAHDFEHLRRTLSMASLMGAHAILVGLQPGVVSALVELDVNVEDIDAALNLDLAFEEMRQVFATKHEAREDGID